MTIRLLRTLVAVADHKTFSAAAKAVHVTHAAVSQQMQTLEAQLGLTLFDRSKRSPDLTPIAQQLVSKARHLVADYDDLVPSLLADGGLSGSLRLGTLRTTLTGLTPQALAQLKSAYPNISFYIRTGLTSDLLADIARGALDAAVVTRPHLMPLGLDFKALTTEPLQLITAIEDTETDPLTLLSERPFIRFNRNAVLGTLIDNWLLSRRIRVTETMELDSPEAITSMVHAKLGVSIVPKLAVTPAEALPVRRIDLGADAPRREIGLAYRTDHIKQQAIDALFEALMQVIDRDS